jgi:peptidoglycan/xylan/chitin deacetylase (PgdA/CDA1 family)
MYHRVQKTSERCRYPDPNSYLSVSEGTFRGQLLHLIKRFKFLTASEVLGLDAVLPRNTLFLTFDDGYRDNFDVAAPILADLNIPATFFITTGFIDGIATAWWYPLWDFCMSDKSLSTEIASGVKFWHGSGGKLSAALRLFCEMREVALAMTPNELEEFAHALIDTTGYLDAGNMFINWNAVRELAQSSLLSVGGHTASHACMDVMTEEEIMRDLLSSRQRFLEEGVKEVDLFAYPAGRANESASLAVQQAGYDVAWMADGRPPAGLIRSFGLPRLGVANHHSPWEIEARLALRKATAGRLPT